MSSSRTPILIACCGALLALVTPAHAQSLAVSDGTVITYSGDTVPDVNGTDIPGYTFALSGLDNPVLDDAGRVLFRAQMSEPSLTPVDHTAYFFGSSRADLKMGPRGGDQAPGLASGVLLRNGGGVSTGLSATVRLAPNGTMWWGSNTWDGTNNGNVLFGGLFGAQTAFQSQGDPAPGTSETFAQTFMSLSHATSGLNRNGRIFFSATLTGPTSQRIGIWTGVPGALALVQRSGSPCLGITGTEVSEVASLPLGTLVQINDANQLLYEVVLSLVNGGTPATTADDRAYMIHTPGVGTVKMVREGDIAPGTFDIGTNTWASFNGIAGDQWTIQQSGTSFTRSGKSLFACELRGGNVIGGTSDRGLFLYTGGALTAAGRTGDAAPGTDAFFASYNATQMGLNDNGEIMIEAALTGGTSTSADDTGIWAGVPGLLSLVAREGQIMPGTGNSTASNLNGVSASFNDAGRVLFNTTLIGGTITGQSWWLWDRTSGLKAVVLPGDVLEVRPGVFRTLTGAVSSFTAANGDGHALRFGPNGHIALRATIDTMSGGGSVILVILAGPSTPGIPVCFGDGSGTACPCGNSGASGRGCASSLFAQGARLSSTGSASATPAYDTLTLIAEDVSGPGLFFQGTSLFSGGAGGPFGDGLLCAGGTILRLGVVFPSGGTATYPGGLTPNPIHVGGATAGGDLRSYQCWYRDALPFCTPQTHNLTNALTLTWAP